MYKEDKEFLAIVESIEKLYDGKCNLSSTELHTAARNYVEFVKIMLDVYNREKKNNE